MGHFALQELPRLVATAMALWPLSASHPCAGVLWRPSFMSACHTLSLRIWHIRPRKELYPFPFRRLARLLHLQSVTARCSLRPRGFTLTLALTHQDISPAPKMRGSAYTPIFQNFRGYVSDSGQLSLHLAELALVRTDYQSSQVLPSNMAMSYSGKPPCLLECGSLPG